ncbi:hypothetical protein [Ruminococcus sp.]
MQYIKAHRKGFYTTLLTKCGGNKSKTDKNRKRFYTTLLTKCELNRHLPM